MATLIYEQAFAPGASAFCQIPRWELKDTGANDPPDPLYPEMLAAESNDVSTGGGPDGENTLIRIAGGDAGFAGIWQGIPGPVAASPGTSMDPTGFSVSEGWIEIGVKPDAAYIAEGGSDAIIVGINPTGGVGGWAYIEWHQSISNEILFGGTDFASQFSFSRDFAALAGVWRKFVIAFKQGASGYLNLFEGPYGGALDSIYSNSGTVTAVAIVGCTMGFAGMLGPVTNFRIYEGVYSTAPSIPQNNSAECCASPGTEGSGVAAPGAGVERPVLMSGAWTGQCAQGGGVALLPDLDDDEDWRDS